MKRQISKLLNTGLDDEVFTAAEVLVAKGGKIVVHERAGQMTKMSHFDLSSLTKPIVVASLFLYLAAEGQVDLEETVAEFLPTTTLKNVSLKDLLEHRSGLVAWVPFLENELTKKSPAFAQNKNKIIKDILRNKKYLRKTQAGKTAYSDLGYIVLGAILEKMSGKTLSALFTLLMNRPLHLGKALAYNPISSVAFKLSRSFIPSGLCLHRQRLLQGEVQDANAFLMGGVAGHAGLFGNALGVHQFLQQWRLAKTGVSPVFQAESFKLLQKELKVPLKKRQRFLYGFDTVDAGSRNFGSGFSRAHTICHLGFSGVSFVWDLSKDVWVILLTNRGMFKLDNPKIYDFRKKFHNLVMQNF